MEMILDDFVMSDESPLDIGLVLNAERGTNIYQPGELMQMRFWVNALLVWVAHDTRSDMYRVAFGEEPKPLAYCRAMDRESAARYVFEEVASMTHVIEVADAGLKPAQPKESHV